MAERESVPEGKDGEHGVRRISVVLLQKNLLVRENPQKTGCFRPLATLLFILLNENEYTKNIKDCSDYFGSNQDKISEFVFKYFEIESLLAKKFPCVKVNKNSRYSTINPNKILKKFGWRQELVKNVFWGKDDREVKSCRLLRNEIVHNFNQRLKAFQEVVERHDSLINDTNELEKLILAEEKKPPKSTTKKH